MFNFGKLKTNKSLTILISLLLCFFSLYAVPVLAVGSTISPTEAAAPKAIKENPEASFLFVQTAQATTVIKKPDSADYLVSLEGVDPWVTYFSNVPQRITGFMPLTDFIKMTDDQIKTKFPRGLNSGLVASQKDSKQMARLVFSLRDLKYDAMKNSLNFTASILPGAQTHFVLDKAKLNHTALFIDDVCISCGASDF